MSKTSYVLSKRIARGGMAEIYLGKAAGGDGFERLVAIKRILPHYAQDSEFIEMFRDEAHICKRLQHANIVQVFDFTEVEESYALIMEHVDGADLRTLLSACESAKIRPTVPMTVYIAACAARGLHYAHTKVDEVSNKPLGIVHRDISPQNILISYEGDVKITDFGIASAGNKMTETRPGVVKGKYSYMSPEQVAAKPLDGRADVFSLAVVLWETLAMKRLFSGSTEVETIRKVQQAEIPYKLTELNRDVTADLMEIVHRGLAKDRKKRYQTAASFEKALLKYLHTHYSEFVASELGDFLKQILAQKRDKSQIDIKQTLTTHPKLPQAVGATGPFHDDTSNNTSAKAVNIDLDITQHQAKLMLQTEKKPVRGPNQTNTFAQREHVYSPHPLGIIHRNRKKKKTNFLLIFSLTFLTVILTYPKWIELIDDKLHFELVTEPESVSLTLNGKKVKKGHFNKTPITLDLPPGKHQLIVEHPGYLPETIQFQGSSGETLKPAPLYLKKDSSQDFVSLKITSQDPVEVNFHNGLEVGTTPLAITSLAREGDYVISFTINDGGQPRVNKCLIKPGQYKTTRAFFIEIVPTGQGKAKCTLRTKS
ncbi:MAG: protein kinase [Oligoflexales bacterium]